MDKILQAYIISHGECFPLSLRKMMNVIRNGQLFGQVRYFMYTIEWQTRGLSHADILT